MNKQTLLSALSALYNHDDRTEKISFDIEFPHHPGLSRTYTVSKFWSEKYSDWQYSITVQYDCPMDDKESVNFATGYSEEQIIGALSRLKGVELCFGYVQYTISDVTKTIA